jgi:putative phosphoribosyl transferase
VMRRQTTRFADRTEAGLALAAELVGVLVGGGAPLADVVVLALPRGGVPVAAPVADALSAPLDVLVVRKLGLPAQPELAMGAIAGVEDTIEVVRNQRVLEMAAVAPEVFDAVLTREVAELREREQRYRPGRPLTVMGRTVVLVDDGLATGSTMLAAVAALRRRSPAAVVAAVPVGAPATCTGLQQQVDRLVCLLRPDDFWAVGQVYDDFAPTAEDEVRRLLDDRRLD